MQQRGEICLPSHTFLSWGSDRLVWMRPFLVAMVEVILFFYSGVVLMLTADVDVVAKISPAVFYTVVVAVGAAATVVAAGAASAVVAVGAAAVVFDDDVVVFKMSAAAWFFLFFACDKKPLSGLSRNKYDVSAFFSFDTYSIILH